MPIVLNQNALPMIIQPLRGWLEGYRCSPSSIAPPAATRCNMELIAIQPLRGNFNDRFGLKFKENFFRLSIIDDSLNSHL